jgi:glycine cleavage system H protein
VDIPEALKYVASHEWVAVGDADIATVGITAVATDQLGELVYVELPKQGERVLQGEACAVVESTKAASDVYAPVSGDVVEVNDALADAPQTVNESPYERGWLYRVRLTEPGELAGLLDAARYRETANAV